MATTRASNDLTQGSVFRHIVRLVAPMSFGILAMMLVGIVDTEGDHKTPMHLEVCGKGSESSLVLMTSIYRRIQLSSDSISTRSQLISDLRRS